VAMTALPAFLRQNSRHYFQEAFDDYDFGCSIRAPIASSRGAEGTVIPKRQRVLLSGTKASLVTELEASARAAGFVPTAVVLSQVGLFNAAMLSAPDLMRESVIALVDLGFHNSTISFAVNGELGLSRVVPIGGHSFTTSLAAALGVPYAAAEGVKTVMPDKVQAKLHDYLAPLGQELRAAIDFFESQEEKKVSQILVSGGTARSDLIVQGLQTQLGIPCQKLDTTASVTLALPPEKEDFWAKDMPSLTAAIGAAAAALKPELLQLNVLAEKLEEERQRRRDPFKRGVLAAVVIYLAVLVWAAQLALEVWTTGSEVTKCQVELAVKEPSMKMVTGISERAGVIDGKLRLLGLMATNRFRWASPLNALKFAVVDDIQVVHVQIQESIVSAPAAPEAGAQSKKEPVEARSTVSMIIRAKNMGAPGAADKFIERITSQPYFARHLIKDSPVVLRERLPPQVDPLNPARSFVLFTIECFFSERAL